MPYPDGFGVQTKIPVKAFSEEKPVFFVEEERKERFLSVSGKEPVSWLNQIMHTRFSVRDGVTGIILPESAPQDSGQNP